MLRFLWCVPFINGIWFIFSCFRLQAFIRLFSSFYIIAEKEERNGKSCVSFVMLCKLLSEIFSFHISGKIYSLSHLAAIACLSKQPTRLALHHSWMCMENACFPFRKKSSIEASLSFGHLTSIPPTDFPINLIDLAFLLGMEVTGTPKWLRMRMKINRRLTCERK